MKIVQAQIGEMLINMKDSRINANFPILLIYDPSSVRFELVFFLVEISPMHAGY